MESWEKTLLGKAVAGVFRVIGRDRVLHRMQSGFRSVANFYATEVTEQGTASTVVRVRDPMRQVDYNQGLLEGGLAVVGYRAEVSIERVSGDDAWFRVTWRT